MKLIPIYSWTKGVGKLDKVTHNFLNRPWASGVILLGCVIVAMLLANLPFTKHLYHSFLETELSMSIQSPVDAETGSRAINWVFPKDMTVEKFINDILMVVFFFTVGLEIKREIICGELSSVKKAMLPGTYREVLSKGIQGSKPNSQPITWPRRTFQETLSSERM